MRTLIIAPSFLNRSINEYYFSIDKFYDVKIVSKEDLYFSLYGFFDEESLIEIFKNHNFSFSYASVFLSLLPYVKFDSKNIKIHDLFLLRDELIQKEHLVKNEYDALLYKNRNVLIIGYSPEDELLKNIISILNIKPTFIHLSESNKFNFNVERYANIEDEAFATMNKIASFINQGIDVKDILIYCVDSSYFYYLDLFSKSFNFKVQTNEKNSYYSLGISKIFLQKFNEYRDVEKSLDATLTETNDDEYFEFFKNEISKYYYSELSFEKQLDLFINILKRDNIPNNIYSNWIYIIDKPTFIKGKHVLVLGFNSVFYPQIFKDNDYLNDNEKREIGINDSLNCSKCEHDVLVDFLKSGNYFYVSFCKKSSTNTYYPSPLTVEYNLKIIDASFPNEIYSQSYADFYYAKALDNDRLYKEKNNEFFTLSSISHISYLSYHNEYLSKKTYFDGRLELSFTSIDKFFNCPFSYYLNYVVGLDDIESSFNMKIGNIAHYIFQNMWQSNFDFFSFFEKAKNKESPYSEKEELLLIGLKDSIKKAVDAIFVHLEHMHKYEIDTEIPLEYTFDKNTVIKGRIDKSIIIDKQYLTIFDYKTGSKSFDDDKIEKGLSLQLPIYCYLAHHNPQYSTLDIGGIYIHNVLSNKTVVEQKDDDLIPNYLKLNGKTLNEEVFIQNFDDTVAEGKSSFINSLRRNKDTSLAGDSLIGNDVFEGYIASAENKIKEANDKIRKYQFYIKPVFYKNELPCKYCSYRDVCFVRQDQIDYQNVNEEESEDDD